MLFRTSGTYPVTLRCPTLLGNDSISPEDKKRVHLAKLFKKVDTSSACHGGFSCKYIQEGKDNTGLFGM